MTFDVAIIGAGSAGAVLAARLSEDRNCSVLLLEAGRDYLREDIPAELGRGYGTPPESILAGHSWNFAATATPLAPQMSVLRGKVVGGSSQIGGQAFLRGIPEDYDAWAASGNDAWTFDQVLPFFRRLETDHDFENEFHGRTGPVGVRRVPAAAWGQSQRAFYEACRSRGFEDCDDHNHPLSTGVGPMAFSNIGGERISTAVAYLNTARNRTNLVIRGNCEVDRLTTTARRASSIVGWSDALPFRAEADEIILCAGAIGSPRILLNSGVGPAGSLEAVGIPVVLDLPGVGQNGRDHPQVRLTWGAEAAFLAPLSAPNREVVLRYSSGVASLRNDMKISMLSRSRVGPGSADGHAATRGVGMTVSIQLASSVGEVSLLSNDPKVAPSINYRYLEHSDDRRRLAEGVRLCLDLASHSAFERVAISRQPSGTTFFSDSALEDWLLRNVTTGQHIVGTCKMGPAADRMAVVNQYGKVHGFDNVRVIDASIMPDCVRANTNATAMMIGERLAEFVLLGKRESS